MRDADTTVGVGRARVTDLSVDARGVVGDRLVAGIAITGHVIAMAPLDGRVTVPVRPTGVANSSKDAASAGADWSIAVVTCTVALVTEAMADRQPTFVVMVTRIADTIGATRRPVILHVISGLTDARVVDANAVIHRRVAVDVHATRDVTDPSERTPFARGRCMSADLANAASGCALAVFYDCRAADVRLTRAVADPVPDARPVVVACVISGIARARVLGAATVSDGRRTIDVTPTRDVTDTTSVTRHIIVGGLITEIANADGDVTVAVPHGGAAVDVHRARVVPDAT